VSANVEISIIVVCKAAARCGAGVCLAVAGCVFEKAGVAAYWCVDVLK
jgi:hypothetical protein